MAFSFFPKETRFFDLFAEQNRKLKEAAVLLRSVFFDFSDVQPKFRQIYSLEGEGNELSREIARKLGSTFITPLDREDIHGLNVLQEEVLNLIKAIATRVGLYRLDGSRAAARDLVDNLQKMVEETGLMLDALRRGAEITEPMARVKSLKDTCDALLLVALGELYEQHSEMAANGVQLLKWTQIYDRIESALNHTEDLANLIEGILLKNA